VREGHVRTLARDVQADSGRPGCGSRYEDLHQAQTQARETPKPSPCQRAAPRCPERVTATSACCA